MKRIDVPLAADVIFYTASAWLVLVGILHGLRLPAAVVFSVATLLALAVGALVAFFLFTRRKKRALGRQEKEMRERLMLHLALERDERVRAALLEALVADGRDAHCEGDALSLDGQPLVPIFTMQPVAADAVAHLLKNYGTQPFTVACNALSPEAERLLASFARSAMTADEVYALFARTGTIPKNMICAELARRTVKSRLRRACSKRNAYPFFVSGTGLLVMSLFVFFPVYYLIAGSLLLAAAIVIRAAGYA